MRIVVGQIAAAVASRPALRHNPRLSMDIRVEIERPAPRHLQPAIDALCKGGVIIYPTDTGYAFGCALSSLKGIARLRKLKGYHDKHPKPLTMLVNEIAALGRYGHMGNRVFRVVRRLLPGPYTMVLSATNDVPRQMKNRWHEVGMRVPDHAVCTMLVDLLGEPLLTGSVTSADAEFELEEPQMYSQRYARDVQVVVDGGPLWPEPSTVLKLVDDQIEVLREGQGEVPE
ncbi:MAG: threonylcarbamoyl-AMP synthase [Deltaproteobacteria bacterium]|nr:threonylcarbamoyl-AMP synthase [Deltaproteobacteria bacterium]